MRAGKVKFLSREEIATMKPNEPTNLAQNLEQQVKDAYQKLSWTEQASEIQKLNGRILARIAGLVQAGVIDDQVLNMLSRASSIAKAWSSQDEDRTGRSYTKEELQRIASGSKK